MNRQRLSIRKKSPTAGMSKERKVRYWAWRLGTDVVGVVILSKVFSFSAVYHDAKVLIGKEEEFQSVWKWDEREATSFEDTVSRTDIYDEKGLDTLTQTLFAKAQSLGEENDCELVKAHFVRVVDGDTIVVEMDKEEYTVRLIGINTPESVASEEYLEATGKENTAEGVYASEFLKSLMEGRTDVYLMKDVSETDKYGRLLRYVWLDMPSDSTDINEISTKMLNAILLEQGVAEIATYEPDVQYQKTFESLVERE